VEPKTLLSHGASDQAAAQHKAVIAIGNAGVAPLVALIATLMLKRPAPQPAGVGR